MWWNQLGLPGALTYVSLALALLLVLALRTRRRQFRPGATSASSLLSTAIGRFSTVAEQGRWNPRDVVGTLAHVGRTVTASSAPQPSRVGGNEFPTRSGTAPM
jgi:hypothetical protein